MLNGFEWIEEGCCLLGVWVGGGMRSCRLANLPDIPTGTGAQAGWRNRVSVGLPCYPTTKVDADVETLFAEPRFFV